MSQFILSAPLARSALSGSNATPLVSRYSCRGTLCRIFRLTFSQCRTRVALHPESVSEPPKKTSRTSLGPVLHLNFALYRSQKLCRGKRGVAAAVLRYTAPLRFCCFQKSNPRPAWGSFSLPPPPSERKVSEMSTEFLLFIPKQTSIRDSQPAGAKYRK